MTNLTGKVALITGASQGIGEACDLAGQELSIRDETLRRRAGLES